MKKESLAAENFALFASIMLTLIPIAEFAWYFLSEPLRFYYDPLLNSNVGSVLSGLLVGFPHLVLTIISTAIFAKLFLGELRADQEGIMGRGKETGEKGDAIISVVSPLVDLEIAKYFVIIGIVGAFSLVVLRIIQSVVLYEYYVVLLSDGLLAVGELNSLLNLTYLPEPTLTLAIALGFFGVFSKSGQRTGYIFFIAFAVPIFTMLQPLIYSIVILLQLEGALVSYLVGYGTFIVSDFVLSLLLWRNKDWISSKKLLAITCLLVMLVRPALLIWSVYTNHLGIQYDISTMTVTGSVSGAMLVALPSMILNVVNVVVYAALFIFELRNIKRIVDDRIEDVELTEAGKEIHISR